LAARRTLADLAHVILRALEQRFDLLPPEVLESNQMAQ